VPVGDEDELRARIEAQIASRRAELASGRGADRDDGPDDAADDAGDPAPSGVAGTPVPRYLEPIRPWLVGNRVERELSAEPDAAEHHAPSDAPTGHVERPADSRTLEPVRPWLYRRPSEPPGQGQVPSPEPQPPAPHHPPGPDRRDARVLGAPPDTPPLPGPEVQTPPPGPEVQTPPPGPEVQTPPPGPEVQTPPAGPAEPAQPRRRWGRRRHEMDEPDDDLDSMTDWLAPVQPDPPPQVEPPASAAATGATVESGADPSPSQPPPGTDLARRLAAAAAAPPVPVDEDVPADESLDDDGQSRPGPLRRALAWLLEPADRSDGPAPPSVWAAAVGAEPMAGAVPPEPPEPPVTAPPEPEPLVTTRPEPEPPATTQPEPVAAAAEPNHHVTSAEPTQPSGEPAATAPAEPATSRADLARRRAAANAAARERAGDEAAREPAPLVTGTAFARRTASTPEHESEADDSERPRTRGRALRRLAVLVVVVACAAAAALLLRTFVVAPYFIPSASMEPTLHGCPGCNNDRVLVNKLSYRLHGIHRGDVVVFHRPKAWQVPDKVLIKRVIGLPGDVLTTRKGVVYVDGLELAEPYLDRQCTGGTVGWPRKSIKVPEGKAFVMGDNRCDSSDSRRFGAIPESSVIGRAFVTIWPFGRIHWL
jgi:signal peptidase I